MSRQSEREEFLVTATQEGIPLDVARKVLRHGATLTRLAVAQCNGDWPCDNGERETRACPACGLGYAPSSFRRGRCPECRTQDAVTALLMPYGVVPMFGGDPRGCVVKLKVPSGKVNDWGREGICVPA